MIQTKLDALYCERNTTTVQLANVDRKRISILDKFRESGEIPKNIQQQLDQLNAERATIVAARVHIFDRISFYESKQG